MSMLKSVQVDKIRETQIKLFRERIRPNIDLLTEGVVIVRGVKGVKRPVIDNAGVRWSDTIRFEHPKISDISIWDAFYEKYMQYWGFKNNPLENESAFVQELHDLIEHLNRSTITPNDFRIVRERPRRNVYTEGMVETAKRDEKFDFEKYPRIMKVEFNLRWIIKP